MPSATPFGSSLDRICRKAVQSLLSGLNEGLLKLVENGEISTFGALSDAFPAEVVVKVRHPRFYRQALLGGSIGAGEAYMAGAWETGHLTDVLRLVLRNQSVLDKLDTGWSRVSLPVHRLLHFLRKNTRRGSRRNIIAHYDLGNDFYALFLDPTMTYSCGIFEKDDSTLEQAAIAKYDRLCRKLNLKPQDHLVEIGTGWGGFAMYAAQHYGCRVTTTTISDTQYRMARERIRNAGLQRRIHLLKKDYRRIEGRYDKLVSIEMIEAVGHHFFDTFFKKCSALLKPDGVMALQAITISDQIFKRYKYSVDFIKRYIFPGSCLPSITAISNSVAKATDLHLFHLEDITPHYARTLRRWRQRFMGNLNAVRKLGYPESFIRMWEFYLCYCEAGFLERYIGDLQMIFTKPRCTAAPILPPLHQLKACL